MLYSIHTFITFLYPEEYEEARAFEEDNKELLDNGDIINTRRCKGSNIRTQTALRHEDEERSK